MRSQNNRPDSRPAEADLLRRMDRESRTACLFAARTRLPRLRRRHPDGVFVTVEVGCVQQIDMQCVTLDPFTAVDQPPQVANRAGYFDSACVLNGMTRAHLIRNGADTADAGGNVRHLMKLSTAEKCFEEARRFEDLQLYVRHLLALDLYQQGAFAFDTRQVVDFDGLTFHALRSLCGRAQRRR